MPIGEENKENSGEKRGVLWFENILLERILLKFYCPGNL